MYITKVIFSHKYFFFFLANRISVIDIFEILTYTLKYFIEFYVDKARTLI